jgi:DNA-binding response OmpR family regulator
LVSFIEDQVGELGLLEDPLRLAIVDDDLALTSALSARAAERGWESYVLSQPATRRLLARMGIDAFVVNPAAVEFDPWGWLGRVIAGLPGLAVVVVAGPSTVDERIHALRRGVDDWLEKPTHPDELIERIAGAVRRRRDADSELVDGATIRGRLKVDAAARRVLVGAASTTLTERELEVLGVLMASQGSVVERERIFLQVWGYTMVAGDRSVDVYVRRIRDKLRRISPGWTYIHTQFRVGYRFQPERATAAGRVAV